MPSTKHKNYEILNLLGYGLAKFGLEFVQQFGCSSKAEFYKKWLILKWLTPLV